MNITTKVSRSKLSRRPEPYWHRLERSNYIGFRRTKSGDFWIARLTTPDRKYRFHRLGVDSKTFSLDQASKSARDWFRQIEGGEDHEYTVKRAVEDYIAKREIDNGFDSATGARQSLFKHLPDRLMNRKLASLRASDIRKWRDGLVAGETDEDIRRSKCTANRVLSMFKSAANHAYNMELIASRSAWERVKPFPGVEESRKLFLTPAQVSRLIEKAEGDMKVLIQAGVLTGCRIGELVNLTVGDFQGDTLHIQIGKTGQRVMFLSKQTAEFFKTQCKDKLPGAPIFTINGEKWKKNMHTRRFQALVRKARLPHDAVYYSLRHYHISQAMMSPMPIQMIAENCGTSVRMIEQTYGHFRQEDRRKFLDQVSL